MSKNIFQKQDFKAITTFSVHTLTEVLNEKSSNGKKDNLIFITSFGYVVAESIVNTKDFEKPDNPEDLTTYLLQTAIKNRNESLAENKNEGILESNTSFVLKNVLIKTYDGHTSNLPLMILFSDSIQGLTFGSLS